MWVQSLGGEDPLEMEMATYSCTLGWEIPWTEGLGRLQSMGSQRFGKDPDAGKAGWQEEKGMTEDEMVDWHH